MSAVNTVNVTDTADDVNFNQATVTIAQVTAPGVPVSLIDAINAANNDARTTGNTTVINLAAKATYSLTFADSLSAAVAPPSFTQAAISLYQDGYQLGYNPLLAFANNTAVQADIALNTPYAQPFASLFVLAAEMAGHSAFSNIYSALSNSPAAHAEYETYNNFL